MARRQASTGNQNKQPNQLKVLVLRAGNIGENRAGARVNLQLDRKVLGTEVALGREPSFNQSLLFFVEDEREPLQISLVDAKTGASHLTSQITIE